MAYEIYKTYLISTVAKQNPMDKSWTPKIAVRFQAEQENEFHELQSVERFPEPMTAEQYGINLAKAWINQYINI